MSKVEELWEQIQELTMQEKVVIYKRIKHEVYNRSINIYCNKQENKEDYTKY
jgi:hypothetical protein